MLARGRPLLSTLLTAAALVGVGSMLQEVAAAGPAAGIVSQELSVSGAVKTPLTLKVEDLKAFAPEQISTVAVVRRPDDKGSTSTIRGVRLTAVLERAALANTEPNDWKHTVVTATATDGYAAVLSWPELFNTDVGAGVLVVFERDGQALTDRDGRIALFSSRGPQDRSSERAMVEPNQRENSEGIAGRGSGHCRPMPIRTHRIKGERST